MATSTITVDLDAYRRLEGAKRQSESFSTLIKRQIRPPTNVDARLKTLRRDSLSRGVGPAGESTVTARRRGLRRER